MFRGRFEYTMDAKGRMSLPARFREVLRARGDERVVITNYFESCLVGYACDDWRKIEEQVSQFNTFHRESRKFQRFFLGAAVELSLDKQGRFLIPTSLRRYAGLNHDVILQGLSNKFEIWSRESWEEEMSFSSGELEKTAQYLAETGLKL